MTGADRSPATADEVGEAVRSVVFVVPAHDEELVVGRCLQTLLAHSAPGELRIVVVSNGSTDATADRARDCAREGERLTVLELPVASKIEALRAGLSAAGGAPVVVLDADVELPTSTARTLAAAVAVDGPLVAAPRLRFELEHASAVVRRYYRVWSALPYATGAAIGSGVYALTADGVARLGPVPDMINDDGWVRRAFAPDERRFVDGEALVHPARTLRSLVSRRARVVNGNRQIDEQQGPDADAGTGAALRAGLRRGAFGAVDAMVFLAVTALARGAAARRRRRGDTRWSTDTTSRIAD